MAGLYVPLDGVAAYSELMSWEDGPSRLKGQDIGGGLLMLLAMAELSMVGAGIGPQIVISEKGAVPTLGAARARLGEVSPSARAVYLGCQWAARRVHASVRYPLLPVWQRSSPAIELGPVVAGVIAVGLAALIGGAWYYKAEVTKTELVVNGEATRAAQVAATVVQLATPYLTAGQAVPPAILAPLSKMAAFEKTVGTNWPLVGLAGVGVLVAGAVLGSEGQKRVGG